MINKKLDSYDGPLTKNEEKIKARLKAEDFDLIGQSISTFSARLGTTPSSVSKYLDKVGLEGWKFLQTFLTMSLTNSRYKDWTSGEKQNFFKDISSPYFLNNSSTQLKNIIRKHITSSEIVYIVGEGETYYQAQYFAATLNKLGITSSAIVYSSSIPKKLKTTAILLSISGYNDYIMWFYRREQLSKCILMSHYHHKDNREIKTAIIGNPTLSNKEEKFMPLDSKLTMDIMIHDFLRNVEAVLEEDSKNI